MDTLMPGKVDGAGGLCRGPNGSLDYYIPPPCKRDDTAMMVPVARPV
jgi:hypothetical protein